MTTLSAAIEPASPDPARRRGKLGRFRLLASGIAGRSLDVMPAAPGEHPWTDGMTIFLDDGASAPGQVAALAVQASLIAAGSLEPGVARRLAGRLLLRGGDTEWVDGPLTRAVRDGAVCYLDEVVEARQDTTVVLHPLADHRRQLPIDRLGITVDAAAGFCLVVSYNPGYQSVLKDLKDSTRQRMIAIEMGFPPADVEEKILVHETGIGQETAARLVQLGQAIRRAEAAGLREVASTRVLIAAGRLAAGGLELRDAARAAAAGPLTDDPLVTAGLIEMIDVYLAD